MQAKKKILLGISGGIAAYKSLLLIRLFVKNNYEVKVVVTKNALEFVTPLSIETLSKNKVYKDVFESTGEYSTDHISLTDECDTFVVAPATANVIGKFANGIADDALSTSFLAFNKPVLIAPAMNSKMYEHKSVQENMQKLKNQGVEFIEPNSGELACGYDGKGRMSEPEEIFQKTESMLKGENTSLVGKKIMITAGPTYESIDPVRFIGNYSSGKMGYAIADEFAKKGAEVILISGPVAIESPAGVYRKNITSAEQMFHECVRLMPEMDVVGMAAAVADYRTKSSAEQKIKKTDPQMDLPLVKTVDILSHLGTMKSEKQILCGFALETENEIANATKKLHNKNLDIIVLNSLNDQGAGFAHDTNKISIIDSDEKIKEFELKSKNEVAQDIVLHIVEKMKL